MGKIVGIIETVLAVMLIVLFVFVPDVLSGAILALMGLGVLLGFVFGVLPAMQFAAGLRRARDQVRHIGEVQSGSAWQSLQQAESLFGQKTLDELFDVYMTKARRQEQEGEIVSDIDEVISEDSLALRCWWGVVHQIPATLTALGLLGTFAGLILGISSIAFSSVEATMSSIAALLSGIRTAFYTSIAGVILSLLFDLGHRLMWGSVMRELGLFTESFHTVFFPRAEEQMRSRSADSMTRVLEQLQLMPKDQDYPGSNRSPVLVASDMSNEQRMMPGIRRGLEEGDFFFVLQPRYDLMTNRIVSGEALVRWDHHDLGIIYPAAFMKVIERNGFVVKLDRYIWEEVCKTLRSWMDEGVRPVPLSVNVSKIDILALDVADIFTDLVKKYDLSPRWLEIEIAENAYLECEDAARELEQKLRQSGFRVIIDGFDEEFLAMSVMKDTQADALKLDLRCMGTPSERRDATVENMLEQARRLRLPVMAKCIESAEQLGDLRRCGCTEGQGNYLSRPVRPAEFRRMAE